MRKSALALAGALSLGPPTGAFCTAAHADEAPWVSVQLVNRSSRSFDYSLQMASLKRPFYRVISLVTLGKPSIGEITDVPIIAPGYGSGWARYTYNTRFWTSDGVSLNLQTPAGKRFGMRSWPPLSPHTCNIPPSMREGYVLLNVQDRGSGFVMYEQLSNGDVCAFGLTDGYGPAFRGGREQIELADPFADPELLRRLDADFIEATGIDPARARAEAPQDGR